MDGTHHFSLVVLAGQDFRALSQYAWRALLTMRSGYPVASPTTEVRVATDEQHIALPKLYGAPAYARPPTVQTGVIRPFDPDELPLEAHQTDDDREFAAMIPARAYAPGGADPGRIGEGGRDGSRLRGRPFKLRSIAGRLLGGD